MAERYYNAKVNNIPSRNVTASTAQRRNPNAAGRQRAKAVETNARRRRRRRKRGNILYFLILMLFVAVALVTLSVTVLFNVSKIEIVGANNVSQSDIIKASGVNTGDNLFRLNMDKVKTGVLDKIESVDKVTVTRKLPSTLLITVEETKAEYCLKQEVSKYIILSKNFRIIDVDKKSPDESAVVLTGISIDKPLKGEFVDLRTAEGYEQAQTVLAELSEQGIGKIKEIDVSNVMNISINHDNKHKILIGSVSGIAYKLQFAKEVMKNNLSDSDKGVIDARREGQLSFRPDDDIYKTASDKKADVSSGKKTSAKANKKANTSSKSGKKAAVSSKKSVSSN